MRWIAADANRCDYSRATAEADLRRAGVREGELIALKLGHDQWPIAERAALAFASQMTLDASKVTDAEMSALLKTYGEEKLTAMVLLLASANFQDRFLLSQGTRIEDAGPLPPVEVRFARDAPAPAVPPRSKPNELRGAAVPQRVDDPEWSARGFDVLQKNLSSQRANAGRIHVPSHEEVMNVYIYKYYNPKAPIRIKA